MTTDQLSKYEISACIGLVRMGAKIEDIMRAFPYWDYSEIEKIIEGYKLTKYA